MRIISCNLCGTVCDYDILKGKEIHKPDLNITFYEWTECPNCKQPIELKEAEDKGILQRKTGYDIDDTIYYVVHEHYFDNH